jgi:hypothetical protein
MTLKEILNQYQTELTGIGVLCALISTIVIILQYIKSFEVKNAPIITIKYNYQLKQFEISNIGQELAVDITIETFHVFIWDIHKHHRLDFSKIHNLKPGETKALPYMINGKQPLNDLIAIQLHSKYAGQDNNLILTTKDIKGQIYYEKVSMGKSGINVRNLKKAWWLQRYWYYFTERLQYIFVLLSFNLKRFFPPKKRAVRKMEL